MSRAKTPRIIALIASIAFTGLIVKSIAEYGYPAHEDAPVVLAKAPSTGAR